MGTAHTLTVFDEADISALDAAKTRVLQLHRKLNAFDPDSEISRVNRAAGRAFVPVSADTFSLIRTAAYFAEQTDGCYDPTAGAVSMLWKQAIRRGALPSRSEIRRAVSKTDYRDIEMDAKRCAVRLRRKGQALDLGGIAKGYAADEVRRILRMAGVENALANLGGTVVCIGKPRQIGVQDPFRSTGTPFTAVTVCDKALVTSGVYARSFVHDGKTYHHIIDPKTGFPSDSDLRGITLLGAHATALDALATATFLMEPERFGELIRMFDIQAICVMSDGSVFATDAIGKEYAS